MTDTSHASVERLIEAYEAIRNCSPSEPWSGCAAQAYSNTDHYDGHVIAKDAAIKRICDALRALLAERDAARDALSNLSSWLGSGLGDEATSAGEYERRIRDGVDHHVAAGNRVAIQEATHAIRAERDAAVQERDRLKDALVDIVTKPDVWSRGQMVDCAVAALSRAEARALGVTPIRDARHPEDGP